MFLSAQKYRPYFQPALELPEGLLYLPQLFVGQSCLSSRKVGIGSEIPMWQKGASQKAVARYAINRSGMIGIYTGFPSLRGHPAASPVAPASKDDTRQPVKHSDEKRKFSQCLCECPALQPSLGNVL